MGESGLFWKDSENKYSTLFRSGVSFGMIHDASLWCIAAVRPAFFVEQEAIGSVESHCNWTMHSLPGSGDGGRANPSKESRGSDSPR